MLRIYCLQQWYNLSDPGAEEVLYDICSMRAFAGLELGRDAIPDETTILNFRHLLERHELTKAVFAAVSELLEARGALLRGGTIVDATLIAASPSTKNGAQKRDPEMRSSKKGNQWYFGMKAHIGVDAKSGLVHTVGVTTGSVHDAKVMDHLIREDVLRHDLCAFIHRSFLELNPQTRFHMNWHIEVLAAKLEEVRQGRCKRLIVNMPPRLLKSHATSITFPAWMLGHDPAKQILTVTYAQDFSDNLARKSRTLITSPFYHALFDTRLAKGREAVSDFETTDGGTRFSTSVGGVLTGRGADIIIIDETH